MLSSARRPVQHPSPRVRRARRGLIAARIAAGVVALAASGCGGSAASSTSAGTSARHSASLVSAPARSTKGTGTTPDATARGAVPARAPFAVGLRVVTFVDRSRLVQIPGAGLQPRTLVTLIRYPAALGRAQRTDVRDAPPLRTAGRLPLVIFGHGFTLTPAPYAPLLQAWARAGYVVAAPIFPLEKANAPGGPDESDLVDQPGDMSFVITRMLNADSDSHSFLHGLLDSREIAVSGHSDGGDTALTVAYDPRFIDRRVRAAVILSGAKIPGLADFRFPTPSSPLLTTQGTADTINPPSFTHAFFDGAPPPKYLLDLLGAPHLGPYSGEQPFTGIVERVTIAFLDHYLKGGRRGLARMRSAGDVNGVSVLESYP